jgi:hypothetical protein
MPPAFDLDLELVHLLNTDAKDGSSHRFAAVCLASRNLNQKKERSFGEAEAEFGTNRNQTSAISTLGPLRMKTTLVPL